MADIATGSALSGATSGAVAGTMFMPGIGTAIGAVIGGAIGLFQGIAGESAAEDVMRAQIKSERLSLAESLRRFDKRSGELLGGTKASAAAAGVSVGVGSPMELLRETENELNRERQFLEQQSLARQRVIRAGGQAAGSELQSGLLASSLESAGSAFEAYDRLKPPKPFVGPPEL